MPYSAKDLNLAFYRAVIEINDDIADGVVPASVNTFSELHDHVDANEYGGLLELTDLSPSEVEAFGNALQSRLDEWLQAGRRSPLRRRNPQPPRKSTVQIPGVVYADYVDGKIAELTFLPHASHAGYFGKSAQLWDGDKGLDIENTEGPFWTAMQKYLCEGDPDAPSICWRE